MCHPDGVPPLILFPPPPRYCTECKCSASPCYVANGNYFTTSVDLRVSSVSGPLQIVRRYDSAVPVDGPAGVGWASTFTSRLFYATFLLTPPSTYEKRAYVVLEDGTRLSFTENANGVSYVAGAGRYDTLVKNGDGTFDLTLQGSRTRYHYSTTGALLARYDDQGNLRSFTYDGNGRLQQIADGAGSGRYLTIYYGPNGRVSDVQDSGARYIHYSYNTDGTLATFTDAAGRVTTYAYQATAFGPLLSTVTDSWGRVTASVTYDDHARISTLTSGGVSDTFDYDTEGPSSTQKHPAGTDFRWYYAYDANGLITDRTRVYSPLTGHGGPTAHTDYYPDSSIMQTTDELGVKTFYSYDSTGRTTAVTRDYQGSNAIRFDYAYDPSFADRVSSITPKNPSDGSVNLDWQAWRYDYYQAGSLSPGTLYHVYRVKDDGTTLETMATYAYNAKGQVTQHTSPTGGVTDYSYDASWNLWKVTGPSNNDAGTRPVTTYGYDSLGRVTSVQDALAHTTSYLYDNVDRVTSVTLPKPSTGSSLVFTTTYSYDNYDASTGLTFTNVTDPNAKITKQGYDQWGRLVQAIDAQSHVTSYLYAAEGTLTSITDANGNVTSYVYDDLTHALTEVHYPDASMDSYTYNTDGTLDIFYSRDGWRRNTYDHLKRVTRRDSAPPYFNFTYVGQKLTQVVQGDGYSWTQTDAMTYDHSYRLDTVTEGTRGTIDYGYNVDDSRASYAVTGGPTATYAYYPDGSLNTIAWTPVSGNFKYRYSLTGQYQSLTYPNGGTRNYTYDDQGRLTQLTNLDPVAGNLATYAYGYDYNYTTGQNTMLGQRSSMTATVPSQNLTSHLFKYEYDPLYQLKKVTYPNVTPFSGEVDSWTYDAIGNRLTNTVNGSTQTYSYQKIGANSLNWQRLMNDGTNAYTYDLYGNVKTRTGYTLNWDMESRMTSITGTSSYIYDYQNRRESRTVGAATNTYLYDRLNLIQEQGASTADYLFGPGIDEPLAMSRGGQAYYYIVDGLGSVAELTNSAGTVQNSYLYDAWGQTRSQTGSLANPFSYTARELAEASTMFYRARYYQPSVGRFLQEDPLDPGALSTRYAYVLNSPVSYTDPNGLAASAAHVCCKKQTLTICWDQNVPNPILRACVEEHEQDHVDYVTQHTPDPPNAPCQFPSPCAGKPDGAKGFPITGGSKTEMECQGYRAEYRCLQRQLRGAPDPQLLMRRMNQLAGGAKNAFHCDITK